MARPKLLGDDQVRVNLQVPRADKEAWEAAAQEEGFSLSDWIRRTLNARIAESKPKLRKR